MILKSFIPYIAFIFFGSVALKLNAVTDPVLPLRACLDKTTNTVTVFFRPSTDGCGSFTEYRLYGREDAINPFSLLATTANQAATQISHTLPNKKKWEFFIVTRFACNGTDTLKSISIFLDDDPPALLNLDSVSVDLTTQWLVAGWQKAPEPDVMGYSIFKVDAGTGNNILIKDTQSTGYRFFTSTFNTNSSGNRVAIAVFDSCTNGGIICNYHSPVLLSYNMSASSNYRCDRIFRFTWTGYVGWSVNQYSIWYKDDVDGIWKLDGTVAGSQLNYAFNIPFLNRTYTFFVRAHNSNGISSTSNTIQVNLPDYPVPAYNEIGHVSVVSDETLEITGSWDSPGTGFRAELQESLNGSTWSLVRNFAATNNVFRIRLFPKQTNAVSYYYRIVVFNPCNAVVSTSGTHNSIVLSRNGYNLSWNNYAAYNPDSEEGFEERDKQSSTWNNFLVSSAPHMLNDTSKSVCYRIVSYRITGPARTDTAYSNEICLRVFDTTLVPTGFNPDGPNKIFKVTNPNLEPGQATMLIFNRWGEKIFEGDALSGWDGTYRNQPVITGLYIWQIRIFRKEKRETLNGTVILLR